MNRPSPRSYASPLREDQANQTRQRIVDAAAKLIVGGIDSVTMALVASEARVGLRTVFNYFATREELLDATWTSLNEQIGEMPELRTLSDLTTFIPDLYGRYGAIEDQIRAVMLSSILQASRKRQGSSRRRQLRQTLSDLIKCGDGRQERMARSAAYLMTIPTAMLFLKDNYELTTEEAAGAAAWAVEVLINAAKVKPPEVPR